MMSTPDDESKSGDDPIKASSGSKRKASEHLVPPGDLTEDKEEQRLELHRVRARARRKRDKARRGKLAKTAAPEIDAQTKKEAQDLSEKLQQHGRELNETKARLNAIRREIQRTTLTCARGVGRRGLWCTLSVRHVEPMEAQPELGVPEII